jgi:hypothetical protein
MEPKPEIPQGYPVDSRNFGTLLYHPYPPGGPTKEFSYPVFQMPSMMPFAGIFPFTTSSLPGLSMGSYAFDPSVGGGFLYPTSLMPSFLNECSSSGQSTREELTSTSPTEESSSGEGGGKFSRMPDSISFDSTLWYPNSSQERNVTDKIATDSKDKRRYRLLAYFYFRVIL